MSTYSSMRELLELSEKNGTPMWRTVQLADCAEQDITPETSWETMKNLLSVMRQADRGYDRRQRSVSGLSGGDAGLMEDYIASGKSISGPLVSRVMAAALRMGECNACMKRIVAAPTAGACGVLPAVLLTASETLNIPDERVVEALYVAAGVGSVIAQRASISGAECGCQAEIGSAASMAAAALVHLLGGAGEQMANAAALALKSLLGLVCDPVGGLVEVPCIKRNVTGAVTALTAAEMAMAGIRSRIPADEVFDAMREIGEKMDQTLRETGEGGLAATETGRQRQTYQDGSKKSLSDEE